MRVSRMLKEKRCQFRISVARIATSYVRKTNMAVVTHCNKNRNKAVVLYCNPRPKPVAQLIADAMHESFKD